MSEVEIVAEIGINHNSRMDYVQRLIDTAKESGVDYIKFQKRDVETSTPKSEWNKPKRTPWGTDETYIQYRRTMELGREEFDWIENYCLINNIEWFSSVFDLPSLEFMKNYCIPYIKIPSAQLTNHELIKKSVEFGTPLILSTGMSTKQEIQDAINLVPNDYDLTIMACTSSYPCEDKDVDLLRILTLKELYPQYRIGYSHHHKSPFSAIYSTILGAEMVELHLSLDRTLPGTDQVASQERHGAELIVREIRRMKDLLGEGVLRVRIARLNQERN